MSRYWLAHNAGLTPDLVYGSLRGDTGTGDQAIGAMFDALDLRVLPGDKLKQLRSRKSR